MQISQYRIASYVVDKASDSGFCISTDGDLNDLLGVIIDEILIGQRSYLHLPGLEGFVANGRAIGKSLEVTVTKTMTGTGSCVEPTVPVATAYFALNNADVPEVCLAAVHKATASGFATPHSEWLSAMKARPVAPFHILIPALDLARNAACGRISQTEIGSCTGFLQTICGSALEKAGVRSLEKKSWRNKHDQLEREENVGRLRTTTTSVAAVIQSDGEIDAMLIVEKSAIGPSIYAYVNDIELEPIRIDFLQDIIIVDTKNRPQITLDSRCLDTIHKLRADADMILEKALDIINCEENRDAFNRQNDPETNLDPFEHLYTH